MCVREGVMFVQECVRVGVCSWRYQLVNVYARRGLCSLRCAFVVMCVGICVSSGRYVFVKMGV